MKKPVKKAKKVKGYAVALRGKLENIVAVFPRKWEAVNYLELTYGNNLEVVPVEIKLLP